jgi:hypothetical protein
MLEDLRKEYVGKPVNDLIKHLKTLRMHCRLYEQTKTYDSSRVNVILDANDVVAKIVSIE